MLKAYSVITVLLAVAAQFGTSTADEQFRFPGFGTNFEGSTCRPAELPPEFDNFKSFCKHLRTLPDGDFKAMFAEAPSVVEDSIFPLHGCTYGCVVGNSIQSAVADNGRNGGRWNGKCFRDFEGTEPSEIVNIVNSRIGRFGDVEAYSAKFSVDETWNEEIKSRETDKGVWVLDYARSRRQYGRDFSAYRDEMKQVAPGVVLGKVFIKPRSPPYNPFNPNSVEAFHFALFQVCDKNGDFPKTASDRNTKRV